MSKVSVFDHGWIDLVFEGRNQQYGAYQLRKQDAQTTIKAFFTGIGILLLLVGIPAIANYLKPVVIAPETIVDSITPVDLSDPIEIPVPPVAKPEPIASEPAAPAAQSVTPTTELKPLVATSEPTPDLPTTSDFDNAPPAAATTAGTGTQISLNPGTATSGTGTYTGPTAGGGEGAIENFVDVAPLYPGGLSEFYKDVANKFRTPEVANATTMKVYVSFVVEPDGTLSNIKATKDPGYGMGAEAVRVLKSLKAKWTPGKKGGRTVRTAYNLPITVKVH